MSKGLEVNAEIGLCTKDMAKENPVKDFEILIEEYKDKWSKQMYDYFKECLNEIKKKEKALKIIKEKRVDTRAFIEILEDEWTWEQYMDEEDDINTVGHQFSRDRLTQEEYYLLKEVIL